MINLSTLVLDKGEHATPADGYCLLEAVAAFAGESHSDMPDCVSPVLAVYGRDLNDILPDPKRQQLISLILRLVGTAGDGKDMARHYLAADWLARVYYPEWLSLSGLIEQADTLRNLAPLTDEPTMRVAVDTSKRITQSAHALLPTGGTPPAAREALWGAGWAASAPARSVCQRVLECVLPDYSLMRAAGRASVADIEQLAGRMQDSAIRLYAAMIAPGGEA